MVDLDHFKLVNDRYGHLAGDVVLREIGRVLPMSLRPADVVCRYGGEEFCIVLPDADGSGAQKALASLAARLRDLRVAWDGATLGGIHVLGRGRRARAARQTHLPNCCRRPTARCTRRRTRDANRIADLRRNGVRSRSAACLHARLFVCSRSLTAAVTTDPMVASRPGISSQFSDFSRDEFDHLFERTRWIKDRFKRYELYQPLRDRTLAMVFEKASTRTRVSFEAGMNQLGGIAINLNRGDTQLSRGEPIEDVARVISRMVDVVMIRTFEQSIIERFAAHSRVPVINGLTNEYHPCQILADMYTYIEHRGSIRGRTVAWIGDANNVCAHVAAGGADLRFQRARLDAARLPTLPARRTPTRRHCASFDDPRGACKDADLVTTDVWTSMGFEAENDGAQARVRAIGRSTRR